MALPQTGKSRPSHVIELVQGHFGNHGKGRVTAIQAIKGKKFSRFRSVASGHRTSQQDETCLRRSVESQPAKIQQ
jgi:hypothetical protein